MHKNRQENSTITIKPNYEFCLFTEIKMKKTKDKALSLKKKKKYEIIQ